MVYSTFPSTVLKSSLVFFFPSFLFSIIFIFVKYFISLTLTVCSFASCFDDLTCDAKMDAWVCLDLQILTVSYVLFLDPLYATLFAVSFNPPCYYHPHFLGLPSEKNNIISAFPYNLVKMVEMFKCSIQQ